jgi:hypothetical protein
MWACFVNLGSIEAFLSLKNSIDNDLMAGTLLFNIAMSILRAQTCTRKLDKVVHTETTFDLE